MSGVLIAVPHASVRLPEDLKERVGTHVDTEFLRAQSDMYTDTIYDVPGATNVVYQWSRFVADPNRFEGQKSEGGIVPLIDFDERSIYRANCEPVYAELEERIARYHRPYHERLRECIDEGDFHFFFDGHSMMSTAPKRSPDFGVHRPDACLSNCGDERGEAIQGGRALVCSPEQTRLAQRLLREAFEALPAPPHHDAEPVEGSVLLNKPFLGGHGVRTHARPERGMPGLQIELNQRLWIEPRTGQPLPGRIDWMRKVVAQLVAALNEMAL